MKLEFAGVWGISKNHLKILETIEKMTNTREYIPVSSVKRRVGIKANFYELAYDLVNLKFLTYLDNKYKLSISGHDCLAINFLRMEGLRAMGTNIGIGKESDIYLGDFNGVGAAIKIFRLGRTSFRNVSDRDLKNDENWLSLNRECCKRELKFLNMFKDMEVPRVLAYNRHALVMKIYDYEMLYRIKIANCEIISQKIFKFIYNLWIRGYVHGDLNEFNIMVKDDDILVLDFPQCISISDKRAPEYLKRDVECIRRYFLKKNFYKCDTSLIDPILQSFN